MQKHNFKLTEKDFGYSCILHTVKQLDFKEVYEEFDLYHPKMRRFMKTNFKCVKRDVFIIKFDLLK